MEIAHVFIVPIALKQQHTLFLLKHLSKWENLALATIVYRKCPFADTHRWHITVKINQIQIDVYVP